MRSAALRALLVLMALGLATSSTLAAPRPDPSCSWSPAIVAAGETSTMTAVNLPDRDLAITTTPYPAGVWAQHDGTYVVADWVVQQGTTFYIWTRGGGDALFKPGRQLNDYHPIAMCSVEVTP